MRIDAHCTTTPEALAAAILHGDARQQAAVLELLAHGWAAEAERGQGLSPAIGLCAVDGGERASVTGAHATAARLRLIAAEIEDHAEWKQGTPGRAAGPRIRSARSRPPAAPSPTSDCTAASLIEAQIARIERTLACLKAGAA